MWPEKCFNFYLFKWDAYHCSNVFFSRNDTEDLPSSRNNGFCVLSLSVCTWAERFSSACTCGCAVRQKRWWFQPQSACCDGLHHPLRAMTKDQEKTSVGAGKVTELHKYAVFFMNKAFWKGNTQLKPCSTRLIGRVCPFWSLRNLTLCFGTAAPIWSKCSRML